MKKVVLILMAMLPISLMAQEQKFEFKLIDSCSDSKAVLYTKAKIWVTKAFKSAKDVIQMDDKEAGRIMCKGLFDIPVKNIFGEISYFDHINFTASIDLKEKKYRIILSDFSHEGGCRDCMNGGSLDNEKPACGTFYMTKTAWKKKKESATERSNEIIDEFSSAMKKPLPSSDF